MIEDLPFELRGRVVVEGECWIFTGTPSSIYGFVKVAGKHTYAHRHAYRHAHGTLPKGLNVCHTCDRPRCVRPLHLYAGTQKQNMEDRHARGRTARGEAIGKHALTQKMVEEIRAEYVPGKTRQVDLAAKFGVTQSTVSKVLLKATWA